MCANHTSSSTRNRRQNVNDMKKLTLIRHAKSSWEDAKLADIDRPLNKRGRNDAPKMAQRIAADGFSPGRIITSPARRDLQTAEAFAAAIDFPARNMDINPLVYGGSTEITIFDNDGSISQSFNIGTIRVMRDMVTSSDWDRMKNGSWNRQSAWTTRRHWAAAAIFTKSSGSPKARTPPSFR